MNPLRGCAAGVLLAMIVGSGCAARAGETKDKTGPAGHPKKSSADEREHVLKLINEERKKHDLPALRLETKMDEQAQHWADHLHKSGKLQHGGFKGDRGQCIAEGQPTPEAVVKAWLSDAGHRKILLGKDYRELGVGRSGKYWVTDFK
jgi:uncharacterized protein YkwD